MKRSGTLLLALFLGVCFAPLCGATVYYSDGSAGSVQAIHDTQAQDGDTITLPAGTFDWTSDVRITKNITLQGQTTIGGTPQNPVVNDATVILDDTPRSGPEAMIINVNVSRGARITGITFAPGVATSGVMAAVHLRVARREIPTAHRITESEMRMFITIRDFSLHGGIRIILECANRLAASGHVVFLRPLRLCPRTVFLVE